MDVNNITQGINAMDVDVKAEKYPRRAHLRNVEQKYQEIWENEKVFEANVDETKEPYFVTFPYPYMNGRIHIGHAFTVSKADFAAGFQRLNGKNVLFPFGFHCTGMPIVAAANKLKSEMEMYGNPPKFPSEAEMAEERAAKEAKKQAAKTVEQLAQEQLAAKSKGKKTKLEQKKTVWWWDTLARTGVDEKEIPEFVDPEYWLKYFPPSGITDLKSFGLNADWRRSFITTSSNKFYDSFIQWQFRTLKKRGVLEFGKRPTIFSITDQQACLDHERSEGENVNPQEYTLIKIQVKEKRGKLADDALKDKKVFLVAATLRPETMYGQTNCFVLPDGEYGVYATCNEDEVFVCSERSANNMAYQFISPGWGEVKCHMKIMGHELLGLPLAAPNAKYETVYCLPLLTIKMNKGTGVVTSVPSDAPDDYAALTDLKNKAPLREKYGITEEMVLPFEVVPIIHIPKFGDTAAVFACEKYKIKSQNDTAKLKQAKDEVYLAGFNEGVMLVGSQKGKPVNDAKPIVKQEMVANGQAVLYYEPEAEVISRSGDSCIVAQLDQWFIKYGEAEWRERVEKFVKSDEFEAYTPLAQSQFEFTLGWLREWACSRSFGLGTKLPWDTQFVIESLSDSTIYFAYYTIAHYLHGEGNLDGSKPSPSGVTSDQFGDAVWDYLFLNGAKPSDSGIDDAVLQKMYNEFNYWYPIDLRVSGKDLIKNHLTMSLYNHAAIWENDISKMPRSFFTNGMVVIDGEKMGKSKGNFLMLQESCSGDYYHPKSGASYSWTADSVRFTLACAGDGLEDANYDTKVANASILELYNEDFWIAGVMQDIADGKLRTGGPETYTFMDKVFINTIAACVKDAYHAYEHMRFRDVVVYAYYNLRKARDTYRDSFAKSGEYMHVDVIKSFIRNQAIIMSPITPHICEKVWREHLGNNTSVLKQAWPKELHEQIDSSLWQGSNYLFDTRSNFLSQLQKSKQKSKKDFTKAQIYLSKSYPAWKINLLNYLRSEFEVYNGNFPRTKGTPENKEFMKKLGAAVKQDEEVQKAKAAGLAMKAAAWTIDRVAETGIDALALELPFDEEAILKENLVYLKESLGVQELAIYDVDHPDTPPMPVTNKKGAAVEPSKPKLMLLE